MYHMIHIILQCHSYDTHYIIQFINIYDMSIRYEIFYIQYDTYCTICIVYHTILILWQ